MINHTHWSSFIILWKMTKGPCKKYVCSNLVIFRPPLPIVPYSPAFTGMPLYTKPPIFKNGQVVSYISACRTLFGDYGMPYYLKLFRRPCRSIWNSENIMKWPTNWITTGHIGWNLGAYSSFMRLKEEVVTRDKITTKARGGNDRGRGCDVV